MNTRLLKSMKMLKQELEVIKLQKEIGAQVDQTIKEASKKYMLWEQLRVIKKELGIQKDDKDALVEKFQQRIKDKTVPKAVATVIEEELQKLNFLENNSSEFT